ncbi:hypothetical protein [Nannocystis pusilla]|uniref:hypothetical protein n=1 Tax=Nannocystis pusilla TaxID=889268 RepID=UPI003B80BA65
MRIDAPRGIYLYSDQFPELAELRLVRTRVHLDREDIPVVDVQTDPPLGPLLEAIVQRASDQYLAPLLPARWLREHGVLPPPHGNEHHHVLWRQPAGGEQLEVHTQTGFDVELRHTEEALVLTAPGGLSLGFPAAWHVPPAQLRRIAYRWEDGALEVDGDPGLGEFGQAVLTAVARTEGAPRAPSWLGLRKHEAPVLDEERLARFSGEVFSFSLPVLGRLELRMDPQDTLGGSLGPAELTFRSERGLFLVARDLGLMLELRSARYDLPRHELVLDTSPPAGDYLVALATASLEAIVLPALRKAVPLWPDADPNNTWLLRQVMAGFLGEKLGLAFDLTLPPGASLTVARVAGALAIGATAPLQVRPVGESLIGEFAVEAIRWRPDGEQIELVTQPPAGRCCTRWCAACTRTSPRRSCCTPWPSGSACRSRGRRRRCRPRPRRRRSSCSSCRSSARSRSTSTASARPPSRCAATARTSTSARAAWSACPTSASTSTPWAPRSRCCRSPSS